MDHDQGQPRKKRRIATRSRYAQTLATKLAFLELLIASPGRTATLDDIEANLGFKYPDGGSWRGNAVNQLQQDGLIQRVDFERSARPARHRGLLRRWRLADLDEASRKIRELRRLLAGFEDEGPDATGSPATAPIHPNKGTGPAAAQPSLF